MRTRIVSRTVSVAALAIGIAAVGSIPLHATTLDLTGSTAQGGNPGSVNSGIINGAYFNNTAIGSTGTGVIQSFVRLSASGNNTSQEGYNASARPVMPDVNTSPQFTHDIQIVNIPVVTFLAGNPAGAPVGSFYEFLLDVNQNNTEPGRLLSLDALRIYTTGTALANANTLAALTGNATLKYDLDAGTNSEILTNANLNAGSGYGDVFAYIPTSLLGSDPSTYVYLYSQFGLFGSRYTTNDGFEEWAVRTTTPVNVPGVPDGGMTAILLGGALLGLAVFQRRILS